MGVNLDNQLVVALSSRALFDFEAENQVFDEQGDRAYERLQLERADVPAKPGVAFPLVRKLLAFNDDGEHRVEVVILSRNDPVSGLRAFKSAKAAGINVQRGVFTRGAPPFRRIQPLGAPLILSANDAAVNAALDAQFQIGRA